MLFRLEWKKLHRPVMLTIIGLTVLCCILVPVIQRSYCLYFPVESWEVALPWFTMLYPLFVTVPVCWQLYYERRNRFITYTKTRVSPKRYLSAKYLACALSAFLILFIPHFISGLCAVYLVTPDFVTPHDGYTHFLYSLFVNSPVAYILLLSVWKGMLGILTMTFGFVLALYSKNIFIVLTLPFVYTFLENVFWQVVFHQHGIGLFVAFEPSMISPDNIDARTFVIAPAVLVIVMILTWFYYAKLRHREVYPL